MFLLVDRSYFIIFDQILITIVHLSLHSAYSICSSLSNRNFIVIDSGSTYASIYYKYNFYSFFLWYFSPRFSDISNRFFMMAISCPAMEFVSDEAPLVQNNEKIVKEKSRFFCSLLIYTSNMYISFWRRYKTIP